MLRVVVLSQILVMDSSLGTGPFLKKFLPHYFVLWLRIYYHEFRNGRRVFSGKILMRKQEITIIAFALWIIIVTIFMLLSQIIDFQIFFVISLIGFLIIMELITTKYVQPGYLRYLRYLIAAAIVIFGVIVAQKVMDILAR
jgi:hypothetical protein